jgi:hypothetical protein
MNVVNLFAGEGTWARPWADRGHEVWKTDITGFKGIDHVADILELGLSDIPDGRDVLLASPDCTAFSVASIGTHWGGGRRGYIPRTSKAHNRMALVYQTVAIAEALVARDGLRFGAVENPRGMLRKLGILDRYDNVTVSYCHYGDTRMKPTDLWGVPAFPRLWTPRSMCHNANPAHAADCCCRDHEAAPRGAKTGTQGLEKQARSFMPYELSLDVCLAAEAEHPEGERMVSTSAEGFVFYRSLVRADREHFLTPYTAEQIAEDGGRTVLIVEPGVKAAAGVYVKSDGELTNLFNSGVRSGAGDELVSFAVSLGADHVEYFDEPHLAEMYRRHGFKETERYPFDLNIIREDFPAYDPDISGTPDLVFARR